MQLHLLHPEVSDRDCQHCLKYVYEEEGPNIGQVRMHNGEPLERARGTKPPCRRTNDSCPKGTPEKPVELSDRNWMAWHHYRRCKLLGQWPADELVIERAIALDELMEYVRSVRQTNAMSSAAVTAAAIGATPRPHRGG